MILNYKEMSNEDIASFIDSIEPSDNCSTSELNAILAEVTNRNMDEKYVNKITDMIYGNIMNAENKVVKDRRKQAREKKSKNKETETYEIVEDTVEEDFDNMTEQTEQQEIEEPEKPKKKDRIDEYFESLDNPDEDAEDYDEENKNKEQPPYPVLSFISGMYSILGWVMLVISVVISSMIGFKYFTSSSLLIAAVIFGGVLIGTISMLIFSYYAEKIQVMLSIEDSLYKLTHKDK